MNPTEAHQIVNPKINEILKGCGNWAYTSPTNTFYDCGKKRLGNVYYCKFCKSILKGILISQEKEVEFLNLGIIKIEGKTENMEFKIRQRLQALKISNIDLKEIVEFITKLYSNKRK